MHYKAASATGTAHREKELPKGDWTNELVRWYSLVAKPVPRKEWAKNTAAEEAVAKEWLKLRRADEGRGTWDEKAVQEYWKVKSRAKALKEETGVATHFATIFDICVVKHSELDPSKHRYKGRVVFGGHMIRDEFGLEA